MRWNAADPAGAVVPIVENGKKAGAWAFAHERQLAQYNGGPILLILVAEDGTEEGAIAGVVGFGIHYSQLVVWHAQLYRLTG